MEEPGRAVGLFPGRSDIGLDSREENLADKDADAMLERLGRLGSRLVATRSSNPRALPELELARLGTPYFAHVESERDPRAALRRAKAAGPVLVTGSLYLLADLAGPG